ncbi:MAG: type I glutamate--ammonia ligase [Anaerolineae bacterium]|jgi:glutamine synthetase
MTTREEIVRRATDEGIEFISLQFTDIVGIVKSVIIPINELEKVLECGQWFDGSSVEGFARIAESDMYLVPDLDTYAVIPWQRQRNATARLICDVYTPGGLPFEGDPRHILGRILAKAEEKGWIYNTGPEPEFFLFERDGQGHAVSRPHDRGGYFDLSTDRGVEVRKEMSKALAAFGIQVEASHHEVAPGQQEIDFQYTNALRAADNVVTFKTVLKEVARQQGLHATFMPKPMSGVNGSGMHVHQSITNAATGENLFADGENDFGLSPLARHFVAGQLAHAPGMCAVLAPLVNSYKRLVPGYEAPVYISWGQINRSALIRVPMVQVERPASTRLELRCPDPSCNPYLAFAVMLAAGLDGIERSLEPPPISNEDLYDLDGRAREERGLQTLPGSLGEALECLKADDLIRSTLGAHVFDCFLEAKIIEWQEYGSHVTRWETDRYLRIY